jgi:hypothetical protein
MVEGKGFDLAIINFFGKLRVATAQNGPRTTKAGPYWSVDLEARGLSSPPPR